MIGVQKKEQALPLPFQLSAFNFPLYLSPLHQIPAPGPSFRWQ
jgi:hypothetical protein